MYLSPQLIRGGAESTLLDADGHTPLVKAVLYNHPLVVQALVSAEVDLNMQDSSGTTAAHVSLHVHIPYCHTPRPAGSRVLILSTGGCLQWK